MIEVLAKEIDKPLYKLLNESTLKEVADKVLVNPLEYSLRTIENQSFESLKIENVLNESKLAQVNENKETFYAKVDEDLRKEGYETVPEEELKGVKVNNGEKKFDGVAIKDDEILLIEKKSPAEINNSWWSLAKYDATEDDKKNNYGGKLKEKYDELNEKIEKDELAKGEAPHLFYIYREQLKVEAAIKQGYIETKNRNQIKFENKEVKLGYSVPKSEAPTVESALTKAKYEFEKIEGTNSVTFKIKNN